MNTEAADSWASNCWADKLTRIAELEKIVAEKDRWIERVRLETEKLANRLGRKSDHQTHSFDHITYIWCRLDKILPESKGTNMNNKLENLDKITNYVLGELFRQFLAGKADKATGGIDFDLLQEQKETLVKVASILRNPETVDDISGIIHFIDAFQDMVVDQIGIWEFPKDEQMDASSFS